MKARRAMNPRIWVEELEPRVVLSASPSLLHQVASVATVSTNWSGYAAETNLNAPQNNSVTAVSGSWVVPAVTGSGTSYSSFWVGIDGYSSNTVEQIGTDSDIQNGVASYYAWFEMYPNPSFNEPLKLSGKTIAISPKDTINASVTYTAATRTTSAFYTLSLTDATTGASFTTTQKLAGTQNSSAEWVAEAPSSGNSVLPLANFGTVSFSNASATINGVSGPIDNTANASINMVSGRNNSVIGATSALTDSSGTSSFAVTYNAPALTPPPPPPSGRHGWHAPNLLTQNAAVGNPSVGTNPAALNLAASAPQAFVPQSATTLQQSAIRLSAPAQSPVALSGPGNGYVGDADEVVDQADDANLISIWLPGDATSMGSVASENPQRSRPLLVADATPMQVAPGVQASDVAGPVASTPPPIPEQRAEAAGSLVARTFSKALLLVGAFGFVFHAAFLGKARPSDPRDDAIEK